MAYDIHCRDAGATPCNGHVHSEDENEFKRELLQHLKDKHGVTAPNDTLVDYLMRLATEGSPAPSGR